MTQQALEQWHTFVRNPKTEILEALFAEEVVFYSPVVYTPQKGRMITIAYLMAAVQVFITEGTGFQYVREVVNDQHIILEFETVVDGITINGVDMMEIDNAGKVQSFKVMVRPLKAVNKLQEKMAEVLRNIFQSR